MAKSTKRPPRDTREKREPTARTAANQRAERPLCRDCWSNPPVEERSWTSPKISASCSGLRRTGCPPGSVSGNKSRPSSSRSATPRMPTCAN